MLVTVSAFQSGVLFNPLCWLLFQPFNLWGLIQYTNEEVILHRKDIPSTFQHAYDTMRLKVSSVGEDGMDFGGLTKKFLTMTWAEVFMSYFSDEDHATPYLPLHRSRADEKKFIQIGRLACCSKCLHDYVAAPGFK